MIYNENLKLEQLTNSIKELEAQFTNIEEQTKFRKAILNVQIDEQKNKKENLGEKTCY